jgi:hypothetical protein
VIASGLFIVPGAEVWIEYLLDRERTLGGKPFAIHRRPGHGYSQPHRLGVTCRQFLREFALQTGALLQKIFQPDLFLGDRAKPGVTT